MIAKCVKIMCGCEVSVELTEAIQKLARHLALEGFIQVIDPKNLKIVVCGPKDEIETFLDTLYKVSVTKKPLDLEVEPFVKEKDYRGVFRILA